MRFFEKAASQYQLVTFTKLLHKSICFTNTASFKEPQIRERLINFPFKFRNGPMIIPNIEFSLCLVKCDHTTAVSSSISLLYAASTNHFRVSRRIRTNPFLRYSLKIDLNLIRFSRDRAGDQVLPAETGFQSALPPAVISSIALFILSTRPANVDTHRSISTCPIYCLV